MIVFTHTLSINLEAVSTSSLKKSFLNASLFQKRIEIHFSIISLISMLFDLLQKCEPFQRRVKLNFEEVPFQKHSVSSIEVEKKIIILSDTQTFLSKRVFENFATGKGAESMNLFRNENNESKLVYIRPLRSFSDEEVEAYVQHFLKKEPNKSGSDGTFGGIIDGGNIVS